jgi:hypothetical protein
MKHDIKKYEEMVKKANENFKKEKNSWMFAEIIKYFKDK